MLGHINIWLGPSPFLALDSRLLRGKMSSKKIEKTNNVKTLRRKNGTDLVSKPINWIWSCVLRSFLPPHRSDDCSSKPLRRAFVTPFWKVNSWSPMEIPRLYLLVLGNCYDLGPGKGTKDLEWNFQKPFSRESWFFTATCFSLQNGYANAFCSDPHWLLIHHQNSPSIL